MRIAVLGVGRMGRELVRHMLAAGHEVTVYNRTADAAGELVEAGAVLAATPTDAVANAEAIVSVLFGPGVVREVITAADLAIPAGALWIDVTTIGPGDADEFAAWSSARGIRYVHSPVLGSLAPARAGALGVLLGGDAADIEAATAVTDLWADPTRVHRFGRAAQAAAAKLAVNLGLAVATQGLAEALALGRSSGLTQEEVLGVLDKTPLAGVVAAKGDTIRGDRFSDAQFTVDALLKDSALAIAATDTELPGLAAAATALARNQAAGRGSWDFSVIVAK